MWHHIFFTISCCNLLLLFLIGIHRRVMAPQMYPCCSVLNSINFMLDLHLHYPRIRVLICWNLSLEVQTTELKWNRNLILMLVRENCKQLFGRMFISYFYSITFLISVLKDATCTIWFWIEKKLKEKNDLLQEGKRKNREKTLDTHPPGIKLRSADCKPDAPSRL